MRATRVGQVVSGSLALFLGSVCSAHDIWLSPERSSLAKGDTLTVHLRPGHELNAELELPLSKRLIEPWRKESTWKPSGKNHWPCSRVWRR